VSRFVDKTLQLSNLPALSGYLFGGSSASNILGRWDGDVVAGTFDELAKQVSGFEEEFLQAGRAAWKLTACCKQLGCDQDRAASLMPAFGCDDNARQGVAAECQRWMLLPRVWPEHNVIWRSLPAERRWVFHVKQASHCATCIVSATLSSDCHSCNMPHALLALQVNTHAGWLATNCNNQADYYASYLQQHNLPGGQQQTMQQQQQSSSNNGSGGNQAAPPATAASNSGGGTSSSSSSGAIVPAAASRQSLAAVGEFKVDAARALLEAEIKDAFLGTAGAAAGGVIGMPFWVL